MAEKQPIVVFWFRRDLRLDDNTALLHALDTKYPVLPIFIFDPNILSELENKHDARVVFILNEILNIKNKLEENNSSLAIFHDTPRQVFKHISDKYSIKKVFSNRDYEPFAQERDRKISDLLSDQKIEFHQSKDHIILEGSEVLKQDGTPYKVFTPFKNKWLDKLQENDLKNTGKVHFSKFLKQDPLPGLSLDDLGFEKSEIEIPPKEPDIKIIDQYDQNSQKKNSSKNFFNHSVIMLYIMM